MDNGIQALASLFERALLVREAEEAIVAQYTEQNRLLAEKKPLPWAIKCPTHLSIGQEAAAAALGFALGKDDVLFSTHRCHGHYLGKGGSVRAMFAELFGKVTGCSRGKGGSMHLVDPEVGMLGSSAIVGGSIPLAVGAALAFELRGEPRVAVACLGDGGTEQGVFSESLNFAALRKLPMVFLVENNFYATLSHIESRQAAPIVDRARAFGVHAEMADGSDLVPVAQALERAVAHARDRKGPALVEVQAYRWMSHVGTEPDTGRMRRSQAELDGWRARCPVRRAEEELRAGPGGDAVVSAVRTKVRGVIEDALRFAKESPEPMTAELFCDLGAELQP